MRWRRWLALALVVAGTAGVAVVAVGPIWNRASLESNLRESLQAEGAQAGLRLFATGGPREDDVPFAAAATAWGTAPRSFPGYAGRIRGAVTPVRINAVGIPAQSARPSELLYRDGACRAVRIVQGRCPRTGDEIMVSRPVAALRDYRLTVGTRVDLQTSGGPLRFVVSGVYSVDRPAAPYWFGTSFPGSIGQTAQAFDPLITTTAGMRRLPEAQPVSVSTDYLLDADRVRLADVPRVEDAIARVQQRYASERTVRVSTGFDRVVEEVQRRQTATDVGGTLVTLQLALLAWAVLFQIATDAAEARVSEIALLTLRGASRLRTVVFALTEPLLLLAAAVPLGLGAGFVAVRLLAPTVLLPGTPVLLDGPAVLAAVGGFTGGAAAIVLAARRVLGRSVLELWHRTERSARPARPVVVDVVLAVVALGGTAGLLLAGGRAGPAALLAPGLLVAAAGLSGVRLVPRLAGRFVAPTRTAPSVALFLAVRQVARRPAGLRLIAVLAIALGLASFAGVAQGAAATDRDLRAAADVGAPRTFRAVDARPSQVVAAVGAADPGRRWAMAATTWLPSGGTITGRVLAVQLDRFGAVGLATSGGPAPAEIARLLRAPVRPLTFTGDLLTARITASGVTPAGLPLVAFDLVRSDGTRAEVTAGALRDGTAAYRAAVPCTRGCELTGIAWSRNAADRRPMHGTALLTALEARDGGTTTALPLPREHGDWVAAPTTTGAVDHVRVGATGVRDVFSSEDGATGGVQPASHPVPLRLVATASSVLREGLGGSPRMEDTAGNGVPVRVVRFPALLPVVQDEGAIADVSDLDLRLGAFAQEAVMQVWLGPTAPDDAVQRLAAAGLRLQPLDSTAAEQARLARQGPALSLLLLQACAGAGAVLAMLATAISIAGTARRRSYEAAAMLALGLRRRQVAGGAVAEQALLLAAAVALGVPAGWLAALAVLPVLPVFETPTPIALVAVPSPVPALLLAAVFLVLVLVASAVGAAVVLRSADGARLREGEE